MASNYRKHHAVAIPLPAQGHINSLMRFCKKLAREGFTITFVNIDPVYHRIEELQAAAAEDEEEEEGGGGRGSQEKKVLDIRRAHVPIDGLDLSNNFQFYLEHFFEAMPGLAPHFEKLLLHLVATADPPVTCFISDLYMTTPTYQLAHHFNLPRIVFYPLSANMLLFMSYILHGKISQDEVVNAIKEKEKGSFHGELQGLPMINIQDLPTCNRIKDSNEYFYELTMRELQESEKGGHAMVVTTFEEVEKEAFKALAGHMKVPVYPVGPLVEALQEVQSATSLWKEDNMCIKWLDEQAPHSVIYISFGSITCLSYLQFEELVVGLLASDYLFLFVFRLDLVEQNPYSSTSSPIQPLLASGKCYVVEWTPQLWVLSHPSVGGFLTHCGLNSIMEALVHGVPMLCWPYSIDQFMNAKFVVEEWKVGLWVNNEAHGSLVTRGDVKRSIETLMKGEDEKIIRKNVERLKNVSCQNLSFDSTSHKSLQDLIQSL